MLDKRDLQTPVSVGLVFYGKFRMYYIKSHIYLYFPLFQLDGTLPELHFILLKKELQFGTSFGS